MESDRIVNRPTSWYLINIKARRNQCPEHYVKAMQAIETEDPLVPMPKTTNRYASIRSMEFSQQVSNNGIPKWIETNLVAYTLIDPDKFYNRRTKKDLKMDWDEDITANKKESVLYFIPEVHTLAIKKSSEITLNYVVEYLRGALDKIEPEGFDVDVIKDRQKLDSIINAHSILSIEAEVSFSNPGNTSGFMATFEDKIRETNPDKLKISMSGTVNNPLACQEDGLLYAIINMSEKNGNVKAVIRQNQNSAQEVIDTNEHPFVLKLTHFVNNHATTIYNNLISLFE